jgi:HK97 family phage major capsid protein
MDIKNMTITDIETRAAEIRNELESKDADLDALTEEVRQMEERKAVIRAEAEERAHQAEKIAKGELGEDKEEHKECEKMTNMEVRKSHEYNMAYAEYIKTGDDKECRALLTENVSGTVPVAEYAENAVRTAWNKDGLMSLVRKTYLKGNLKIGWEKSADGAYVHTESANTITTEESLVLGVTNLIPESIKKWISISDEVYDMKGEEFLDYIYDELTYRIAKKAADKLVAAVIACTTGGSDNHPGQNSITATTITVGLVAEAMAQLSDEATNPVVVMNKATWGAFKAAQAANGYNYDPFEGLPVVFNDSLSAFSAATTGVCYAIVGDFGQGAQANFPNGEEIQIKFDDKTKMEYDLVRILGREYVGLGIVAPNAFCMIKH